MKPVRKAVLPVAGFGTRVLPATKAVPKEMLTVFDRPALQYVVDEAREAGIEHFVFITGRGKQAIEDYFDKAFELEATLEAINEFPWQSPPIVAVGDYWQTDSLMPFTAFPNIAYSVRNKPAEGILKWWVAR